MHHVLNIQGAPVSSRCLFLGFSRPLFSKARSALLPAMHPERWLSRWYPAFGVWAFMVTSLIKGRLSLMLVFKIFSSHCLLFLFPWNQFNLKLLPVIPVLKPVTFILYFNRAKATLVFMCKTLHFSLITNRETVSNKEQK